MLTVPDMLAENEVSIQTAHGLNSVNTNSNEILSYRVLIVGRHIFGNYTVYDMYNSSEVRVTLVINFYLFR